MHQRPMPPDAPAWIATSAEPPLSRRRVPPWLVLTLTPALLVTGVLGGVLLLQSPAQADAAYRRCTPKITLDRASVSPATLAPGGSAALNAQLTASCARPALVDLEVYDLGGRKVWQQWTLTTLRAGSATAFAKTWAVPSTQPAGTYALRVGVFSRDWSKLYGWFDDAAPIRVGGASGPGMPTPTPATTPSSPTPMPSPTTTAAPSPTPTTTPSGGLPMPPAAGATPVGSALPTEAQCAASVPASTWEPRPDNTTANHKVPTAAQIAALAPWDGNNPLGMDPKADVLRKQITGNYTGTTDQIIRWVACKWGMDPDIVRAQAVVESWWHMSQLGDWTTDTSVCPPGGAYANGGCYESYGLLQIRWRWNKSAWPMSREDTAFSAEYTYGVLRACYEGWMPWLANTTPQPGYPRYHAGDIWGCLGYWNAGSWYSQQAINYVNNVRSNMAQKTWLTPSFHG